jgi:uncharacterized SAM-binding protein YcdF (DUF218 family)
MQPLRAVLSLILAGIGLLLLLAAVGNFLVVDDPVEPADAIVVLAARESRAREAAALYHRGLAPTILLAQARGRRDEQARVLLTGGVPETAIARLTRLTGNTRDELEADFEYAQAQGFRRLILVTSPYHTRRVSLTWQRVARGRLPASVHATPYEHFEPNFWWTSNTQLRSGLHEVGGIAHVLLITAWRD